MLRQLLPPLIMGDVCANRVFLGLKGPGPAATPGLRVFLHARRLLPLAVPCRAVRHVVHAAKHARQASRGKKALELKQIVEHLVNTCTHTHTN
jgi:hypothetical protein